MRSTKDNTSSARPAPAGKTGKRFRIELGITRLLFFSFGLVFVLAWMFVFGVLVGRGLPLVDSGDHSLRAELMRFIGLGEEVRPPAKNAAQTWESPQKMRESLTYYESFSKGTDPISGKPLNKVPDSPPEPKQEPARPLPATAQADLEASKPPDAQSAESPQNPRTEAVAEVTGHFTLLAASVKDASNAENFVKKLQEKGYSPRLETVDMPESGRWTRVLVGSFDSREEALKFAADFNRKENLQGLVIRLGP